MKVYNASGLEKVIPGGGGADGFNIISAGTTKAATTGTVVFSNSNNVTFGMDGMTVTATATVTYPAQTNQTLGLSAFTNTTGQSSSTTLDARTICFIGLGGLSVGYSASSIVLSGAAAGAADGVNIIAAGTRTATTNGTVLFSNANSVSFGLDAVNGSIVTASISTLPETPFAIRAGASSQSTGTVSFSNANGVSFGLSGIGTLTASVAAQSAQTQSLIQAIYDGASSITTGTIRVSNSNGVSFGISGQTLTASVASQTNQSVGLYAVGNSTQNSSTTLDARTLSFQGNGDISAGFSNGSIVLSTPLLSNYWNVPTAVVTANQTRNANLSVSVVPFQIYQAVAFSNLRVFASVTNNTAANTSIAQNVGTLSAVIYTRNASTLSSIWSGSSAWATTWAATSSSILGGVRQLQCSGLATTLIPNDYWVAVHISTQSGAAGGSTATTNVGASFSMIVLPAGASGALDADPIDGGASNSSRVMFPGLGLYSTAATLASIAFNDAAFSQTSLASLANLAINLRNWSIY